jgi:hypothetical protein
MAHQGQSADYYNDTGAPQQPQDAYYQGQPKYPQQPPQYGQNFNNGNQNFAPPQGPPPAQQNGYQQNGYNDNKTFEQQFKVDKPKYNDLWAGILFLAVFFGYVAVSAISIRGYSNQNSGGIYGNANQFALNSNTVILFAFVLGMATLFSFAYMWAARAFTKQFIWITGILNILFGFATALYMLSRKYWSGGIVFLLFSIFYVVCFISWSESFHYFEETGR